jgi:hypothetical protein
VSIAIFTSRASIFLPRYSGVRPTISPAMKTVEDDEDQHAVETGADAAEDDFAQQHVEQRHAAGRGLKLLCMALTEPLEAEVVAAPHRTLFATPKRTSPCPPGCGSAQ